MDAPRSRHDAGRTPPLRRSEPPCRAPRRDRAPARRRSHAVRRREESRFVALLRRAAEAAAWEPDDPRLAELATAAAEHYPAHLKIVTGLQARTEAATRCTLIAHHGEERTPAAARLATLFEAKLRAAGVRIPGQGSR